MTAQALVRPQAWRDVQEIAFSIAEDQAEAADRFVLNAEECFARLAAMPGLGSGRRRVLHGARHLERLLRLREPHR